MKKIVGIVAVVCVLFVFLGCASSKSKERDVPSSFPDKIAEAIKQTPEDALIGVGTAKLASLSQSRTVSASRARAEISRQMNSMVQDMIRDYQASSEVDPEAAISFQENITVSLSSSTLNGAAVTAEDSDKDGNWWTVVTMSKSDVVREITQAQAAARLSVPAMASFDAEARMNEAFQNLYSQQIQVGNQ